MTFKKLAEYFQKLENTASRNEMVVILARLFGEASLDEIDKVVYLTQGRVAPLYEPIEFQMAEKMVIKAISLATNESLETITKNFKQTGDLGETIQNLKIKNQNSNSKLKIGEVFGKLQEITKTSGDGSVEKKIGILAELLQGLDPCSARFVVRIPVDKMRLGFSDMTILEGLSWMLCGSKKLKDELEKNYNVRPDLGFVAKQTKIHNSPARPGRAKFLIQPIVGTPVLSMRAERLTNAAEILEKTDGQCAVEPKLDGLRTQLHLSRSHLVKLYSRGMEDVTNMYPDIVKAAEKELKVDSVILDGEAIGFDPKTGKYLPFQETVQRKRKYDIQSFSVNVPVKLIVFDILYLNEKSYLNEPYAKRRKILEEMLCHAELVSASPANAGKNSNKLRDPALRRDDTAIIIPARMTVVSKPEELDKIFNEEVKNNLEGIMAKKLDGVYQAGARGWNWIKYKKSYETKLADTIDAVVMGLDYGQGKRNKFGVGAFLIGVYDQKSDTYKTVSKVGTGLTDDEWTELKVQSEKLKVAEKPNNYEVNKLMDCDIWLKPKLVGEFRADELTKSPMHTAGYALRFPRLEKWRDKKPEDTTSLQEICSLQELKPGGFWEKN